MDRLRSLGMLVLSFGSFIVVWQLVSTYVVSRHLIPPPTEVLSTAVPMLVTAEILAADSGLGFLLQQSSLLVQTNRVFVVLAVFGALGYASDRAFRFVTARLLSSYLEAHATA